MKLLKGEGNYITTTSGKRCLDFTSGGIFQSVLGNDSAIILDAMSDVGIISCYAPHHENPWTLRYIDMLKEWTGYESVALFSTGAEATEAFWRCCRVYNGRRGIWGGLVDPDEVGTDKPLCDAQHGQTLGALLMAGKLTDYTLGIAQDIGDNRFGLMPEATGCMIFEPYHAASGQFHKLDPTINRIKTLVKEFDDTPLCVDEIQAGYWRTGKQWGHQWYDDLQPDFITIGKAAGAGMPISALLGPKEIMESKTVREYGHLHSTHSGHPMLAAVGCMVIETIQHGSLDVHAANMGAFIENRLRGCGIRHHAGKGLLAGLEFDDDKQARRMVRACQKRGLLVVDTGRKWVKLGPALTITEEELETGLQIVRQAIEEVLDATRNV